MCVGLYTSLIDTSWYIHPSGVGNEGGGGSSTYGNVST